MPKNNVTFNITETESHESRDFDGAFDNFVPPTPSSYDTMSFSQPVFEEAPSHSDSTPSHSDSTPISYLPIFEEPPVDTGSSSGYMGAMGPSSGDTGGPFEEFIPSEDMGEPSSGAGTAGYTDHEIDYPALDENGELIPSEDMGEPSSGDYWSPELFLGTKPEIKVKIEADNNSKIQVLYYAWHLADDGKAYPTESEANDANHIYYGENYHQMLEDYRKKEQIVSITNLDAQFISPEDIAIYGIDAMGFSPDALSVFSKDQIARFDPDAMSGLNVEQFTAFNKEAIAGVTKDHVAALNLNVIGGLDSDKVSALSADAMSGMDADKISAMSVDAISGITSDQAMELSADAVENISTDKVSALNPSSLVTAAVITVLNNVKNTQLQDWGNQLINLNAGLISALTNTTEYSSSTTKLLTGVIDYQKAAAEKAAADAATDAAAKVKIDIDPVTKIKIDPLTVPEFKIDPLPEFKIDIVPVTEFKFDKFDIDPVTEVKFDYPVTEFKFDYTVTVPMPSKLDINNSKLDINKLSQEQQNKLNIKLDINKLSQEEQNKLNSRDATLNYDSETNKIVYVLKKFKSIRHIIIPSSLIPVEVNKPKKVNVNKPKNGRRIIIPDLL